MKEFMQYQLEVAVCMTTLSLLYLILWRKETNFNLKRFLLLSIPVISIVIPLFNLNINVGSVQEYQTIQYITFFPSQLELVYAPIVAQPAMMNSWEIAFWIFVTGSVLLLIRLIVSYVKIWHLYHGSKPDSSGKYHLIDDPIQSFSFFNLVMINKSQALSEERDYIIAHEKAHSRQKHSFDVLLLEIVKMLHWFNPFIWFISHESKQNMEYLADREVTSVTTDLQSYQLAIVNHASRAPYQLLKTQFSKSNLKNRIIMMNQPNNSNIKSGKVFLLMPVLVILIMSFSLKFENLEVKKELSEILPVLNSIESEIKNSPATSLIDQEQEKSSSIIKQGIIDKNGINYGQRNDQFVDEQVIVKNKLNETVQNTIGDIRTGNESRIIKGNIGTENGNPIIGANVIIKGTTIGTISDNLGNFILKVDPDQNELFITTVGFESKIVDLTDQEEFTIKLIKDGDNEHDIPVEMNEKAEVDIETSAEVDMDHVIDVPVESIEKIEIKIRENPLEDLKEKPLILLDGVEISYEELQLIDPSKIASIQVSKDANAIKRFDEKEKNGVIVINSKIRTENQNGLLKESEEGMIAFYRAIQKQIKYPLEARNSGIQGKAFISFNITKGGKIENIEASDTRYTLLEEIVVVGYPDQENNQKPDTGNKDLSLLENEVIRVMKLIDEITPLTKDGKPVDTRMTLPVTFKLD